MRQEKTSAWSPRHLSLGRRLPPTRLSCRHEGSEQKGDLGEPLLEDVVQHDKPPHTHTILVTPSFFVTPLASPHLDPHGPHCHCSHWYQIQSLLELKHSQSRKLCSPGATSHIYTSECHTWGSESQRCLLGARNSGSESVSRAGTSGI